MINYQIERGVKLHKSQIEPNPWNPNKTTDRQQQAIEESLNQFGQTIEILVRPHPDKGSFYQVIDGAHRLSCLDNDDIFANIIYNLSDADAKKLTIIMNETRGQADKVELSRLLADIETDLGELTGIGLPYSSTELEELIKLADVEWDSFMSSNVEDEDEEQSNEGGIGTGALLSLLVKLEPETLDRFKQARDLVKDLSSDPAIAWGQTIGAILSDFLALG